VKTLFKKLMEREKIDNDYNYDWTMKIESNVESTDVKQEMTNKNVNDASTKVETHQMKMKK